MNSRMGQVVKIRAGGEGPWYYCSGSPPRLTIPGCAAGDRFLVLASMGDYPTFFNAGVFHEWSQGDNAATFIIEALADGSIQMEGAACLSGAYLAHKINVVYSCEPPPT